MIGRYFPDSEDYLPRRSLDSLVNGLRDLGFDAKASFHNHGKPMAEKRIILTRNEHTYQFRVPHAEYLLLRAQQSDYTAKDFSDEQLWSTLSLPHKRLRDILQESTETLQDSER